VHNTVFANVLTRNRDVKRLSRFSTKSLPRWKTICRQTDFAFFLTLYSKNKFRLSQIQLIRIKYAFLLLYLLYYYFLSFYCFVLMCVYFYILRHSAILF